MSGVWTFEQIGTVGLVAIGLVALSLLVLLHFDEFDQNYREARATCESIKVGMTDDEVKGKVGSLFGLPPATYVDSKGDGQAWLGNKVEGRQVACNIRFENGLVVFADMMNEGSF